MASKKQRLLKKQNKRAQREAKRANHIPRSKTTRYTPKRYTPVEINSMVKDLRKFALKEDLNNYDPNEQDYSPNINNLDNVDEGRELAKELGINYNEFSDNDLNLIPKYYDEISMSLEILEDSIPGAVKLGGIGSGEFIQGAIDKIKSAKTVSEILELIDDYIDTSNVVSYKTSGQK